MRGSYFNTTTWAILDAHPVDFEGGGVGYRIARISTPPKHRGEGSASALMKEFLADADAEDVTVVLEVIPSGGLTFQQLLDWYTRHGFVQDLGGLHIHKEMRRMMPVEGMLIRPRRSERG